MLYLDRSEFVAGVRHIGHNVDDIGAGFFCEYLVHGYHKHMVIVEGFRNYVKYRQENLNCMTISILYCSPTFTVLTYFKLAL